MPAWRLSSTGWPMPWPCAGPPRRRPMPWNLLRTNPMAADRRQEQLAWEQVRALMERLRERRELPYSALPKDPKARERLLDENAPQWVKDHQKRWREQQKGRTPDKPADPEE